MATHNAMSPNQREGLSAVSSITGKNEYVYSTNHSLSTTATIAGSTIPITGVTTAVAVGIVDGSGNQITSFGGGTQYTQDAALTVATTVGTMAMGRASAAVPTDVSADNDAVIPWYLRSGAQSIQPTYGGVLQATGNGVAGTDTPRVTIASNNTAFSVNATLSAETTKVIGTVNQGTSPWVVSNSVLSVVGNGAAATAQRVTLANDSTGVIATVGAVTAITNALPAGSNVIGHVITDTGSTTAVTGTVTISGTVTANIGTTGGLALDATLTGGTQQTKITDGTNIANVLKSDGSTAGNNSVMIGGAGQTQTYNIAAAGSTSSFLVEGYNTVSVDITADLGGGSTSFQVSDDNTNWRGIRLVAMDATDYGSTVGATGQIYGGALHAAKYFRVTVSGSGGAATGTIHFSTLSDNAPVSQYVVSNADAVATSSSSNIIPVVAKETILNAGGTFDRVRSAPGATNTTGTGLLGAAPLGLSAAALPTAATPTNYVSNMSDKYGRAVVLNNAQRDIMGTQITTITASTAETTIITQAASIFADIVSIFISNTSATATSVSIRDATAGTVIFNIYVPAGDMRGVSLTTPWPQTTVNNNWTATSSASVTSLVVSALFIKNK